MSLPAAFDAYWEEPISPWDIAAGIIMVREAGGFVTDKTGGPKMFDKNNVVAGNERIHKEMLGLLKQQS